MASNSSKSESSNQIYSIVIVNFKFKYHKLFDDRSIFNDIFVYLTSNEPCIQMINERLLDSFLL